MGAVEWDNGVGGHTRKKGRVRDHLCQQARVPGGNVVSNGLLTQKTEKAEPRVESDVGYVHIRHNGVGATVTDCHVKGSRNELVNHSVLAKPLAN